MPTWLQNALQGGITFGTAVLIIGGAIILLVVLYRIRAAAGVLVRGLLLGGQGIVFLLLLLSAPRVHPTGEIVFTLAELLNALICIGGIFWFWAPFAALTAPAALGASPTVRQRDDYRRQLREFNRARVRTLFEVAGNTFAAGAFLADVVNRIAPFGWGIPSFFTVVAALVLVALSSYLFYR